MFGPCDVIQHPATADAAMEPGSSVAPAAGILPSDALVRHLPDPTWLVSNQCDVWHRIGVIRRLD